MNKNRFLLAVCLIGLASFAGCGEETIAISGINEARCGDGIINTDRGEACDDGNSNAGDGCSADCSSIELGFECPEAGKACIDQSGTPKKPVCGNGIKETGEACDDGNTDGLDGCTNDCSRIETGYECLTPGKPCQYMAEQQYNCGNGVLDENEVCDDGNTNGDDGCSADCLTIEPNYTCPDAGQPCEPDQICGDGIIMGDEECDDFNTQNGDGCNSNCQVEPGYSCLYNSCWLLCGNNNLEPGEECDSGEDNSDEYDTYYKTTKLHQCGTDCQYAPYCGDGEVNGPEECDLGTDNNTATYGSDGCTSNCEKTPYCGDGKITPEFEECDPSIPEAQDGCNSDCTRKDGYVCAADGACQLINTVKCGDGNIEGNEECDQTGNGCTNCQHSSDYKCIGSMTAPCTQCGSGESHSSYPCCTRNAGEQCRSISAGYGDGFLDPDGYEECDDGNKKDGDGCSSKGRVESGYVCITPGKACTAICGDGILAKGEECDDGNHKSGDGCSQNCKLEEGYYCKTPGKACTLDTCGNGFIGPNEACDGQTGCGSDCRSVKSGYCYSISKGLHKCSTSKCGNYILEYGEKCDDGNTLGGDGCSADCKSIERDFECPNGVDCRPICGDGKVMWQLGEVCDLGSNNGKGKGCSIKCEEETGYTCTKPNQSFPASIDLDVTYRDFIGRNHSVSSSTKGYVNDTIYNKLSSSDCRRTFSNENDTIVSHFLDQWKGRGLEGDLKVNAAWLKKNAGFPDFEGFAGNLCFGLVKDSLDSEGKPVFNDSISNNCCGSMNTTQCKAFLQGGTYNGASYPTYVGGTSVGWHHVSNLLKRHHMLCADSFRMWYRDESDINSKVSTKLTLNKVSGSKYVFDSANAPYSGYFSPINGQGLKDSFGPNGKNGNFTTEISTTFQYKGGETLNFAGDDDVWVFINGKLFLDIGGMHAKVEGQNSLSNTKVSSPDAKNGGTIQRVYDSRYGLYEKGIYELKVFHAERASSGADFKLTLDGFVNPGTVTCANKCGDGIVAANEECDIANHTNDATAKALGCVNCKWVSTCGNGRIEGTEACDTGSACKTYPTECAKLGLSYNANSKCNETSCKYKDSLCGNGVLDSGEDCDTHGNNTDPLCNPYTCKWRCGDGILDAGEECDRGMSNNDDGSSLCTTKCKLPKCGDGIVSSFAGEICDDGVNNGTYGEGQCMPGCNKLAPYCGDGILQSDKGEECDLGKAKNNGSYRGCTSDCKRASYCGDRIVDTANGEKCDDGPEGSDICTSNCTYVNEIN